MPHSTSNHHYHPTAFYHKSPYSPTASSFPPLVSHPHKGHKSPYSPTVSSFPPSAHKSRPHSPTGSLFPATSTLVQPPPLTNIQTFDLLNMVDQLTKECEEAKALKKVDGTKGEDMGLRDEEEASSFDDEILECQLAILDTQMQLSQILTQTLELNFEIREKEEKIAQKTQSCKRKCRVLAILGERLCADEKKTGAKEDARCNKKAEKQIQQMTQESGFQKYRLPLLATAVLSAMVVKPDYLVAVLYACVFS